MCLGCAKNRAFCVHLRCLGGISRHTHGVYGEMAMCHVDPVNNFLRKKAILLKKTLDKVNLDVVCCSRKQEGGV